MTKKIIEGSEDKYDKGSPEWEAYLEGHEAYMAFGSIAGATEESPYIHQPHNARLHAAYVDGIKDEEIWKLDSTGQ